MVLGWGGSLTTWGGVEWAGFICDLTWGTVVLKKCPEMLGWSGVGWCWGGMIYNPGPNPTSTTQPFLKTLPNFAFC